MSEQTNQPGGLLNKFLNAIEKAGNKLLDPVSIFIILCIAVMVVSAIVSAAGVTAVHPTDDTNIITAVNLLSLEQMKLFFSNFVANFQSYPPLAQILVVVLGVGVAEKSGLMESALKRSVANLPKKLVTFVIVFIGILANAAGDAGFVVLPPLAAVVFISIGRHPLIGLCAAYGGVASGFAANLIVNLSDVLASSFTIPAAQMLDPTFDSSPAMNYYFILVSTVFLSITATFVTEKIVAPRFEGQDYDRPEEEAMAQVTGISDKEKKGVKWAGFSFLGVILVLVLLCIGPNPFMADPETGSILSSNAPLMKGVIPVVTIMFLVPGLVYGFVTGKVKNDKDVVKLMSAGMRDMGGYLVIAVFASQFLALFTQSNLGLLLAIKGAEGLSNAGIGGFGLLFAFILFSCFLNLFIGSASSKWAILAPIFVPMLMLLGYPPALSQMAYRIGDSVTNSISPLNGYFPMVLGYAQKYSKDAGMGTIIANMLPYSIAFLIVWSILLFVWVTLGIPLGPN